MTRINCISPEFLSGKHLVAEYCELPRVFDLSLSAQLRGDTLVDYAKLNYTLGKGHVKFFYSRLAWCLTRQEALVEEMKRRGYSPKFDKPSLLMRAQHPDWCNNWAPTIADERTNLGRLVERDSVHYRELLEEWGSGHGR